MILKRPFIFLALVSISISDGHYNKSIKKSIEECRNDDEWVRVYGSGPRGGCRVLATRFTIGLQETQCRRTPHHHCSNVGCDYLRASNGHGRHYHFFAPYKISSKL
ncbi:hypothetical protein V6Z11_A05G212600 [Gossypium hirsutum]